MKSFLQKCGLEICHAIRVGKNFGVRFGISTFLNKFLLRDSQKYRKFKENHQESVCKYLYNHYFKEIPYYETKSIKQNAQSPIWVMWWQGEKQMPEVVRMCVNSIKKHSANHPVHMITEENYREFISLPDYIHRQVKKGIITITHLSDIIRFSLLYEWGGVLD